MKLLPGPKGSLSYREPREFYRYRFQRDGLLGTLAQNLQVGMLCLFLSLMSLLTNDSWLALKESHHFALVGKFALSWLIGFAGFTLVMNVMRYWQSRHGGTVLFHEKGIRFPKRVMPFKVWNQAKLISLNYEGARINVLTLGGISASPFRTPTELGFAAADDLEPLLTLLRKNGISIQDERN